MNATNDKQVVKVTHGDHFPDHIKFPDFSLTCPVGAVNKYQYNV